MGFETFIKQAVLSLHEIVGEDLGWACMSSVRSLSLQWNHTRELRVLTYRVRLIQMIGMCKTLITTSRGLGNLFTAEIGLVKEWTFKIG